jgi:hypothetical protein
VVSMFAVSKVNYGPSSREFNFTLDF